MKKASLLFQLRELRMQWEELSASEINKYVLINLLLEYINDADIKGAVDDIPF